MARRRAGPVERPPPDPAAALEIAFRYLATRPRSRAEVERRLRRAGAFPETVTTTLVRLEELGYVDDAAFARYWIEQRDRHAPRGGRLLAAELRQRGVARSALEPDAADEPDASGEPAWSEAERADAALRRHLRGRPVPTDPRALGRLGAFLVRRGFDPETARSAIRRAATGGDG